MRRALLVITMALVAAPPEAAPVVFHHDARQAAVLELFTSHGCSSCPPADAWLRRLSDDKGLWKRVIPMAFHVDYWDSLGWPDRFADRRFSQRQRAYRDAGAVNNVYTPGMFLNGREWRGWFWHRKVPHQQPPNIGSVSLQVETGVNATLTFHPQQPRQHLHTHLAILGFGLSSAIGGGENHGRTLREDFVVLGMSNGREVGTNQWTLPWPNLRGAPATRLAVVAWVEQGDNPKPVQAVAGWLAAP